MNNNVSSIYNNSGGGAGSIADKSPIGNNDNSFHAHSHSIASKDTFKIDSSRPGLAWDTKIWSFVNKYLFSAVLLGASVTL